MRQNGYFGIGCLNMKNNLNYGTLFRTAQILEADFIFLIGKRFKRMSSDTMKSFRHVPLYEYKTFDEFKNNLPYGCQLAAIELSKNSIDLKDFEHPDQCCYLLGAEDNGIPKRILDKCNHTIQLKGKRSMNVAVAGSIVLYDRVTKIN